MLKAYLTDTVTLKQFKGADKWGEHNATTDVSMAAHIDYKERLVRNVANEMVVSSACILMEARTLVVSGFDTRVANTISYYDVITVDSVDRVIIKINNKRDFRIRHMEVYVA